MRGSLILLPLSVFIITVNCESKNLLSVVVVFRHGDRTPTGFYPKDPYNREEFWPDGIGQLTNEGIERSYNLGKWLRERYNAFLPPSYHKGTIRMYSTEKDRTLMSAASVLAGLYPPENQQIWNKQLLWRPIPVEIAAKSVISELFECVKFDYLYTKLLVSKDFRKINQKFKDLYKYLTKNTVELVFSVIQAGQICDTLTVEAHNNFTLPNWTYGYFPEKLKELENIFMNSIGYTDELLRLNSGPFLYNTIKYFENSIANSSKPKMILYSGHDVNLATILKSLGSFNNQRPFYANTILFELFGNGTEYFVNVLYKDRDNLTQLSVNDCIINCNLADFKQKLSNYTISSLEWMRKCYLP